MRRREFIRVLSLGRGFLNAYGASRVAALEMPATRPGPFSRIAHSRYHIKLRIPQFANAELGRYGGTRYQAALKTSPIDVGENATVALEVFRRYD